MPFTTLDTLRNMGHFALLNYFLGINYKKGAKGGPPLYLERFWKGALGQDGRPRPQTTGAHGTQTLFSGLLHGEEQPGHRTVDTTYRLDPVSALRAVWHSPSPMFLLASSPSLLGTMEAPRKQAPLLHLLRREL